MISTVIAGLALLVSVVSAWNSHRSRRAAEEARREARRPQIGWEMAPSRPGDPVCVQLTSDRDLDRIVITQVWGMGDDPAITNWGGGLSARRHRGMLLRNLSNEEVPRRVNMTTGSAYTLAGHHVPAGQPMTISARGTGNAMHATARVILRCECTIGKDHWIVPVDTGTQPVEWRFN